MSQPTATRGAAARPQLAATPIPPQADDVRADVAFRLEPIVTALAALQNSLRVLTAISDAVRQEPNRQGTLEELLSNACPTWFDPLANGDGLEICTELARLASQVAIEIASGDGE